MQLVSSKTRIAVSAILAMYLAFALMLSYTKRPYMDEAWVANPAIDLITRGTTGVSVMEPSGNGVFVGVTLTGIDRHSYMWAPFGALLEVGWFKLLGFAVISVRGFAILWGLIALLCWFYIVRKLSGDPHLALLAIALIAIDGSFLDAASDGRMDMLAASLACCAPAAYLRFREEALSWAILLSWAFGTAAFLVHPVGGVGFAIILVFYIYFDRRRFRWWHPCVAALPLLVAAAGWGSYILQNPDDFRMQTAAAFQGRIGNQSLWKGLVREVKERYLGSYLPSYAIGFRKAKVLILVEYLAAVMTCLGVPAIRNNIAWRVLLIFAPLYMLLFALLEGGKSQAYLVFLTPPMAVCLAICSIWLCGQPPSLRWLVPPALVGIALLQIGWTSTIIMRRSYQREYMPVVHFLDEHRQTSDLVYGCGEWAFALGFYNDFKIDTTLGFTTGKRSKFIVWEDRCMQQAFDGYKLRAPIIYQYMEDLLTREYRVVYKNSYYTVYGRGTKP